MKIINPSTVSGVSGSIQTGITLSIKDGDEPKKGSTRSDSNRSVLRNDNNNSSSIHSQIKKTSLSAKEKEVAVKEITKQTIKASVKDKIDYVAKLRDNDAYAILFVEECENKTKNPDHCIQRGSSIAKHESNAGKLSHAFFGVIVDNSMSYPEQIVSWVHRYNKNLWFKRTTTDQWIKGAYCTEENDGTKGCPNWVNNVGYMVLSYKKSF